MEKEIVYEGLGSPLQGEKCKVWKSQIEKKKRIEMRLNVGAYHKSMDP